MAQDASGAGNDGEIDGAKRVDDGKIGKALQFDGQSFVEVESSDSNDGQINGNVKFEQDGKVGGAASFTVGNKITVP